MDSLKSLSQKILEFDEVKNIITSLCHWSGGRLEINKLEPMSDIHDIYFFQNKIRQIQEILSHNTDIALSGLEDISDIIDKASKGSILSMSDFILVKNNLQIVASFKKTLVPWVQMPFIFETLQAIYVIPHLIQSIEQIFDSAGNIKDRASAQLAGIRSSIKDTQSTIHSRLSSVIRDTSRQKMFQELIYTEREGRYVVPIKQEFRGIFEGLVLDMSASGATVFMEPVGIVEHNNELRRLRVEEKSEIERILRTLSDSVGRSKRELILNQEILAHFDMIRTLAVYADKNKCILPSVNNSGILVLKKARHPLLGEKAIPLDLEIGKDFATIVITGPNTGGKTVALKTAGLFSLMGLSGMPLPGEEGTEIALFDGIYADIGDEQSIAQNLSTFSSHINKIIAIVKKCDSKSLVVLDELGAGTDPREGSAIAISLLEYLTSLGTRTIITTHYGELKYFASNHPNACNAAMEFDEKTLQPSYKIITGLPGRSCALAIASRLGFPENLINRAQELLTKEYIEMDTLLANIETKEKSLQEELVLHKQYKAEAMSLKKKYEEDLSLVKHEQLELITDSAAEAESLVISAKSEIHKILKNFNKKLNSSKSKPEETAKESLGKLEQIMERLESFREKRGVKKFNPQTELKEGDEVFVPSMNKNAVILEIKNDDLLLQINKIKMRMNAISVRPSTEKTEKIESTVDTDIEKKNISNSVNLIGLYVDEAIYKLEKYLDEAVLEQFDTFQVIHGMGTGALKNAVHLFLRKSPLVADFRLGVPGEGSSGATIVTLK